MNITKLNFYTLEKQIFNIIEEINQAPEKKQAVKRNYLCKPQKNITIENDINRTYNIATK